MIIPLFGLGNKSRSVTVSAQERINLYAEVSADADKTPLAFYWMPGLRLFTSFGDTPVRGGIPVGDFLYVVHRGTFYEVNNAGVRVARGTIGTTSGRVQMAFNGLQVGVVDGSAMYIYNIDQTAQVISSLTRSGTTAKIVTTAPHKRYTGEQIQLTGAVPAGYNGTYVITVLDATTFTFTLAANPDAPAVISSITNSTTTATMTTATAHGRTTGDVIVVSGATPAAYNGTFVVTVTGTTTLTYTMLSNPGGNATVVGSYLVTSATAITKGAYTVTSSFVRVTSGLFENPFDITWQSHVFIVSFVNSAFFQSSAIDDGTVFDALDFAQAESEPDNVIRGIADHGEFVPFGTDTTEYWGKANTDAFPYSNQSGSENEFGLAAPWSLTKYNDSLAGLMKNKMGQVQVMMLQGHTPTPLNGRDLNFVNEINTYSAVSDATAFSYMLGGHPFYQISFPTAGKSWVYDAVSGDWFRVQSGLNGERHRAEIRFDYLNKPRVTDFENGNIYTIDPDVYTDNGMPRPWEISSRHVFRDLNVMRQASIQIDFETGVGLIDGQGVDPQAMLQISRDNGHTWGNEIWRSMGKIGEYLRRVIWRRLGRGYDFVFKIRGTDPVKTVIAGAALDTGDQQ